MKEDFVVALFSICMVIVILILMVAAINCRDNHEWNNGYHTCGGKWIYDEPVGHAYNTTYLYRCDKCGAFHEFIKFRKEVEE